MAQVEVFNDNKYTHKEMFKGREITIPAGGVVVMEEDDAIDFKGQFSEIRVDGTGKQDPRSFKMIRIGKVVDAAEAKSAIAKQDLELTCQKCGYVALTKKMLEEHIDTNHLEDLEDQEMAEKRRRGRPKKDEVLS